MKAISRFLFLLFPAFVVTSGCATLDDPLSKKPPAQVTVYREPSSRDSFFPMHFIVDGKPVTNLSPDEERTLEIPPGERRFSYELGVYNCAADVRLESGKTYVYRLGRGCVIEPVVPGVDDGSSGGGNSSIKWQDQERARNEALDAREAAEVHSGQLKARDNALRTLRGRAE